MEAHDIILVEMTQAFDATTRWLNTLGYDGSVGVVHRPETGVQSDHPYARELDLMLRSDGEIRSSAVYEVDRVPAVCFIEVTCLYLLVQE